MNNFCVILGLILVTGSVQGTVQSYRALYRSLPLVSAPPQTTTRLPQTTTTQIPSTTTIPAITLGTTTLPILNKLPTPLAQAQERESQNFDHYPTETVPISYPQTFGPLGTTQQPLEPQHQSQPETVQVQVQQQQQQQPQQQPLSPSTYPYYIYAQPQSQLSHFVPTNTNVQPISLRMYNPYQGQGQKTEFDTEGHGPIQGVPTSGTSPIAWFSSPYVKDSLVGLAVLGLVGSGSALLYHQFMGKVKSSRALMSIAEQFSSEDTSRMARTVLKAIQKYSQLNNAQRRK